MKDFVLLVIPDLKFDHKRLFDGKRFKFTDVFKVDQYSAFPKEAKKTLQGFQILGR